MIEKTHELDRLAGQLFQGVLIPEMLPEVIASLAAWLQRSSGADSAVEGGVGDHPSYCPLSENGNLENAPWHMGRQVCGLGSPAGSQCTACTQLDRNKPNWHRLVDLFVHCRALREFAEHAASWAYTSHVAAIVLSHNARILDCDYRGQSFLKAGNVMHLLDGQLY